MPRKTLLAFTFLFTASCLLYFIRSIVVTEPGYPLDDSWIHQVFARNIAQGHGFSFNPGEPISGATAPLWSLLMAAAWPIAGPIAGGIILGVLLEWLALVAVYKIAQALTEDTRLAFLAVLSCAVCWVLVWGALSGMEVGLYSALSLWGLYFYIRARSFEDGKNYLAYFLFALAVAARPECGLFLVAAAIRDLLEWARMPKKSLVPWLGRGAIAAAVIAPFLIFNYATTGTLAPQTYIAKTGGRGLISAAVRGDLKRVVKSLSIYPYAQFQYFFAKMLFLSPILSLALIPGAVKLATPRDALRSKRIMTLGLVVLYLPLVGVVAPVGAAGTYHHLRLVHNIVPLILLIGWAGLFWRPGVPVRSFERTLTIAGLAAGALGGAVFLAGEFIVTRAAPYLTQDFSRYTPATFGQQIDFARDVGRYLVVLGLVVVAGAALSAERIQRKISTHLPRSLVVAAVFAYAIAFTAYRAAFYANDVKNINEVDKAIGLYLREQGSGRVAANDIGAIGYYSGMKVLDLKGLISPQITPAMIADDSLAFEYMLHHDRVDYVAIFPDWFRYIPRRTDVLRPVKTFAVARNTILFADTTVVFRAEWPDTNSNALLPPR